MRQSAYTTLYYVHLGGTDNKITYHSDIEFTEPYTGSRMHNMTLL